MICTLNEYSGCVIRFYKIQYREEVFAEEKRNLLPKDCRFALLTSEALEKIEQRKFPEAVRLFRQALHFYPAMTSSIREIIRQMTVKAENPVQTGEEFQVLAQQMKEALKTMIGNRQYVQALPVILQLSPLLPEDLELLRMRQKVLQETG